MPARRCSDCGINYQDNYRKFKKCLGCGEKTDAFGSADPDTDALTKAFDVYFKQWDADRLAREKEVESAVLEIDDELTAELEATIAKTPSIPDPDPEPPKDEQPEGA